MRDQVLSNLTDPTVCDRTGIRPKGGLRQEELCWQGTSGNHRGKKQNEDCCISDNLQTEKKQFSKRKE